MAKKQRLDSITQREWLNITLGAILGFALTYHIGHSVVTALTVGAPPAALGTALVLLLIKKVSPTTRSAYTEPADQRPKSLVSGLVCMALVTLVVFFLFKDPVSRFVIVFMDLAVILNYSHARRL